MKFNINDIPPMPRVVSELLTLKDDDKIQSAKELEKIIKLDQVLVTRILRVANSAFYAQSKRVSSLSQAIALLGFNTLRSLIILMITTNYKSDKRFYKFKVSFWKHSIFTGFISKMIASKLKIEDEETLFLAGLLHDFGKLILQVLYPEKYKQVISISEGELRPMIELEKEIIGIPHTEAAATAFKEWNFPDVLITAVSEHHNIYRKDDTPKRNISNIVAYANIIAKMSGYGWVTSQDIKLLKSLKYYMEISKEDIEYFEDKITIKSIEEDEFFKACLSLLETT